MEAIELLLKLYRETRQKILRNAADYLYVNAVATEAILRIYTEKRELIVLGPESCDL